MIVKQPPLTMEAMKARKPVAQAMRAAFEALEA